MYNDLISVIILTYKHGEYLLQTMDSIFMQDYDNIEIIIAEDGSADFNKEYIQKYIKANAHENVKSTVFSINSFNVGTVKNLNNALKKANGKYVKIIAGDDVYPNSSIFTKQINELEKGGFDVVTGNIVECDAFLNEERVNGFSAYDAQNILFADKSELLKFVCRYHPEVLATQVLCYSMNFFKENGFFDEDFRLVEDLPMAAKLITTNQKIGYIDWPCVKHRGSVGVSTSGDVFSKGRISYFCDLRLYFSKILTPQAQIIGKVYVKMRIKLYDFRINYAKTEKGLRGNVHKACLCLKYCIPLVYYFSTNLERAKQYITKKV